MSAPGRDIVEGGSFRDPSGFVFTRAGTLYRQINRSYAAEYDLLTSSGLYAELTGAGLLTAHAESAVAPADPALSYKVIEPERVPFISYPYEWSFSQLKAAALATLDIEKRALARGMSLKDASAYNIQFADGRPRCIDTLSFARYEEGEPWIAYRQFCGHFLAPLALMRYRDVRLGQLLRVHIDGVPLDLASTLLPFATRLDPAILVHIHLHAAAQARFAPGVPRQHAPRVSKLSRLGLVDSLESAVRKLAWRIPRTAWSDYYDKTSYSEAGFRDKERIVGEYLAKARPGVVWDLGANTGTFSRIAARSGALTIACDADPAAVEKLYARCVADGEKRVLPLVVDLTNPSPAIGWEHRERMSLAARGPADTILALALVHHLAIANNVPLDMIARFFASLARTLIIEFVPKDDPQTRRLLSTRADIFAGYTREGFEAAFGAVFSIRSAAPVSDAGRVIYYMERNT